MSASSLSSNSSQNLTPQYPHHPEGTSPANLPLSPHSVEENLFPDENLEDEPGDIPEEEEELEADDEEEEEDEDEEEEAPIQPPIPAHQGPRIRFIVNRPTVGVLAPSTAAVANSPGTATSSTHVPTPSHDPYPPPGYIPLPTYPRLAREIGDHDRRLNEIEDTIDLFPEPHQLETIRLNIQQFRHNQQFDEQRILNLENQVDKMQSQMDAMHQMMATIFRQQK